MQRTQRRERQDESGNGPSEGPETNSSLNTKGAANRVCTTVKSFSISSRNPLGMLEIASYVTPGDPAVVREPESHCRKSAES